ncbi:unnamed protein product, partial [Protopolystoma xenopodis]
KGGNTNEPESSPVHRDSPIISSSSSVSSSSSSSFGPCPPRSSTAPGPAHVYPKASIALPPPHSPSVNPSSSNSAISQFLSTSSSCITSPTAAAVAMASSRNLLAKPRSSLLLQSHSPSLPVQAPEMRRLAGLSSPDSGTGFPMFAAQGLGRSAAAGLHMLAAPAVSSCPVDTSTESTSNPIASMFMPASSLQVGQRLTAGIFP